MTIEVLQGTGPLRMWHVYLNGKRVASRNTEASARDAAARLLCLCECNSGGFCGGCGHAGCGRR